MIPNFLRSLAAILRRLIAEGRAVHCAEADAVELELLAGLFEQHAPVLCERLVMPGAGLVGAQVTPADFALGLLIASRARPRCQNLDTQSAQEDLDRAAVRAESALLAEHAEEWRTVHPDGRVEEFPGHVRAHTGTIEGARAAWSFVVWGIQNAIVSNREVEAQIASGHKLMEQLGCYRRELEAMR